MTVDVAAFVIAAAAAFGIVNAASSLIVDAAVVPDAEAAFGGHISKLNISGGTPKFEEALESVSLSEHFTSLD